MHTNQSVGATLVDVFAMAGPRTIVDTSRSIPAGIETAIREFSSVFNFAALGLVGLGAGKLLSRSFNKKWEVRADKYHASLESTDLMLEMWQKNKAEGFYKASLELLESPDNKRLNQDTILEIEKHLKNESKANSNAELEKTSQQYLKNLIMNDLKAENSINFKNVKLSASQVLDDLFSFSRVMSSKKVQGNELQFIKELKPLKGRAAILGIAIGSIFGSLVQPVNNWLTKKRTGVEGFVGVEGQTKNDSKGFFAAKVASSFAFGGFIYKLMGANIHSVMDKIQFKSKLPTINQFKVVYGVTIIGRLLSSRSPDELRETFTRDFLGYVNWIILGGFVQKMTAYMLDRSLIKDPINKKSMFARLKSVVTSRSTSYNELMAEAGIPLNKDSKALTYSQMVKIAKEKGNKDLLKKIRHLNFSVASGLLYSTVILGVGIPKINIWLTEKLAKKPVLKADASLPSFKKYTSGLLDQLSA